MEFKESLAASSAVRATKGLSEVMMSCESLRLGIRWHQFRWTSSWDLSFFLGSKSASLLFNEKYLVWKHPDFPSSWPKKMLWFWSSCCIQRGGIFGSLVFLLGVEKDQCYHIFLHIDGFVSTTSWSTMSASQHCFSKESCSWPLLIKVFLSCVKVPPEGFSGCVRWSWWAKIMKHVNLFSKHPRSDYVMKNVIHMHLLSY